MRKLYIRQKVFKITDHYNITDDLGQVVYHVDQDFKLIGNCVRVSSPAGAELFRVEQQVFTFLPRHFVRFTDGREFCLQSRFAFLRMKIDVLPEDSGLTLDGDLFSLTYQISRMGTVIASIERAFLSWGDCYSVTVFDETYMDLTVAMVIAVDKILDDRQRR